jgi:hypothetical protein
LQSYNVVLLPWVFAKTVHPATMNEHAQCLRALGSGLRHAM